MRKTALVCAFIMLFMLCGCQSKTPVYDKSRSEIAVVESKAKNILLLDDGLIYTVNSGKDKGNAIKMNYYRYYFDGGKTVKIGTVENWSAQSSSTAIIDRMLYLLVITNMQRDDLGTLNLLSIDLDKNKLSTISTDDRMYSYSSLRVDTSDGSDNKLLILKRSAEGSALVEYDPKTEQTDKTRLDFMFMKGQNYLKETPVAMDFSRDMVNVLWLDTSNSLSIFSSSLVPTGKNPKGGDMYDDAGVKADAISKDPKERAEIPSDFCVIGDYVYYKNQNNTAFMGLMYDGNLGSVMDLRRTFTKATESTKVQNEAVFFDNSQNDIYYLNADAQSGENMKKMHFSLCGDGFVIDNVYKSPDDHILISVVGTNNSDGRSKEPRYYYLKLSDLNFSENVRLSAGAETN